MLGVSKKFMKIDNYMALKSINRCIAWSSPFKYLCKQFDQVNQLRFSSSLSMTMLTQPKVAYLKKEPDADVFSLSVFAEYPKLSLGRNITICRPINESLHNFLHKFDLKVFSAFEKILKKRYKKGDEAGRLPTISSIILHNGTSLSDDLSSLKIFDLDGELQLVLLDEHYDILINAPWINKITLPKYIRPGMEVYPVKFEACFTDKNNSIFKWFKSEKKEVKGKMNPIQIKNWSEICDNYFYTVQEDDVNHYLKFTCIPKNDRLIGPEFSSVTQNCVAPSIDKFHFKKRHLYTSNYVDDSKIRVLNYNILADIYATSKEAKVFFNYCPDFALSIDYRLPTLCSEIAGYNADIICLQEVENEVHYNHLKPLFEKKNCMGEFCAKTSLREGTSCFYNNNKFNQLMSFNYSYGNELLENPTLQHLKNQIQKNKDLFSKFASLPHMFQLIVLKCLVKEKQILVIGNLHLYSSPNADHIRLLQIAVAFALSNECIRNVKETLPDNNVSLMICGDFNSTPDEGIYDFIINRSIDENHKNWQNSEMDKVGGIVLSHDFKMDSACGTPKYTNYTELFKGCLDYIYYQTDVLKVVNIIPLPEEKELSENVGLPSVYFPSDHIALVADLEWKV